MTDCPATLTVPSRGLPLLFSIDTLTVPLPDPLEPEVTAIQLASLPAVQLHEPGAVTLIVWLLLPFLPAERLVGLTTNVHAGGDGGGDDGGGDDGGGEDGGGGGGAGAASCETVKDCPAMDSVAVRAEPVFALTVNPTEPLPVPLAPDVIDTHPAPLVAVQAQPEPAVTATAPPLPPAGRNDWLPGEIPYEQDAGGAGGFGVVGGFGFGAGLLGSGLGPGSAGPGPGEGAGAGAGGATRPAA